MLLLQVFILNIFICSSFAINWLGIFSENITQVEKNRQCSELRKKGILTRDQTLICRKQKDLMKSLYITAENFMHYCPNSLESERWNCTTARKAPHFGGDLVYGTKQLAYVHAFSSAFLMRTIARACVSDTTSSCHCQTLNKKEKVKNEGKEEIFHYKGCVDNMKFAEKFATHFGDVRWNYKLRHRYKARLSNRTRTRRLSTKNLVRLHNNELGREVVRKALETRCKCHGNSGTCIIKTCWTVVPTYEYLARDLYEIYRNPKNHMYVKSRLDRRREKRILKRKFPSKYHTKNTPEKTTLVYNVPSPDYCRPDNFFDTPGTEGRTCKENSCSDMCCSRGFTTHQIEKTHRCYCKYYWCCYVKCKRCVTRIQINTCK